MTVTVYPAAPKHMRPLSQLLQNQLVPSLESAIRSMDVKNAVQVPRTQAAGTTRASPTMADYAISLRPETVARIQAALVPFIDAMSPLFDMEDLKSSPQRPESGVLAAVHVPSHELTVVHCGLPSNDWNAMFHQLHHSRDTYLPHRFPAESDEEKILESIGIGSGASSPVAMEVSDQNIDILSFATAKSLYERVCPDGSVVVGICVDALQWLSSLPSLFPLHHAPGIQQSPILHFSSHEAYRALFSEKASEDLIKFFSNRAQEMVLGGKLIVCLPALENDPSDDGATFPNDTQRRTIYGNPASSKRNFNQGFCKLLRKGLEMLRSKMPSQELLVDPDTVSRIILPIYYRTISEITSVFENDYIGLNRILRLTSISLTKYDDPLYVRFQSDGNIKQYAESLVGYVRGLSEIAIICELTQEKWKLGEMTPESFHIVYDMSNLKRVEGIMKIKTLVEDMFDNLVAVVEQNPHEYVMEHAYATCIVEKIAL